MNNFENPLINNRISWTFVNSSYLTVPETTTSRFIKFWILLFFQIASIQCSIFVLHHIFTYKSARRTLSNHVVIAMLIVSLLYVTVDLSLTLNYLREGIIIPQTVPFCFFWIYIDYSLYTIGVLLTTWATFERHILVFSLNHFRSFYQLILFHYLPVLICVIYPFIFYGYAILVYSCENNILDFHVTLCGSPCFKRESYILNWYDMLMHSVLPCGLIVVYSVALVVRVIRQKRRLQQELFSWKKQRRMIVQILSIAALYIIMSFPRFIVILIQKCCYTAFGVIEYNLYLFYLYYFLSILLPFVCLGSLGGLKKKLRKLKRCCMRRSSRVHIANNQTVLARPKVPRNMG